MNPRSSTANEVFPSLSSGLGADEPGLRQFESSLDRIVSGSRPSLDRAEPDNHTVTYNSRFQFFHIKRAAAVNESPANDLASREDSLVKAWRTVSEIDALLGSDFRPTTAAATATPTLTPTPAPMSASTSTATATPSMGTTSASAAAAAASLAEMEERPSPNHSVDEAYVKRLNTELESALNVSLTFKERYRAVRGGMWGGGGGAGGGGGGGGSGRAGIAGIGVGGGGGGGGGVSWLGTAPRGPTQRAGGGGGGGLTAPSPHQRHSDASGLRSPSAYQHNYLHNYQPSQLNHPNNPNHQQLQTHNTGATAASGGAAAALVSPIASPRLRGLSTVLAPNSAGVGAGGAGAAVAAAPPPPAGISASAPTSGSGGGGGPSPARDDGKTAPSPSYYYAAPYSPAPPASPRSVQAHGAAASASTSAGSSTTTPPQAAATSTCTTTAAAAAPAPPYRRPHAGVIRVAVGSALDHGEWDSGGGWRAVDQVHEVYIPAGLQRINPDDLVKVRELGRGCFGSVWLARWRGVEVALKELLDQNCTDGPPNEVFAEAERLASLRHPCVIAFYGIVTAPGCYATVVEYLRMGSLKSGLSRLRKQGADISRRLRAAIALQAARGMEYLHSQFMVHFDLKADNLLCDLRDPGRPVVKIGDLGLSKKKKESFVSGNMRGTLPWMAPELFPGGRERLQRERQGQGERERAGQKEEEEEEERQGGLWGGGNGGGGGRGSAAAVRRVSGYGGVATVSAPTTPTAAAVAVAAAGGGTHGAVAPGGEFLDDDRVNEKVDVFSFGVVLWEIWQLGEQPYSSYNLADIFAGVMTGSLRPGVPADCDQDWAELMQACWHDSPPARPSFTEIAERLDAILERLTRQEATAAAGTGTAGVAGAGGTACVGSRRF
ncbi:hypothetical protein PLESTF_000510900 [Pleodorina starrii]|nr:hypothetical protein PLESTF_000510900 [Pleodorina starrii]